MRLHFLFALTLVLFAGPALALTKVDRILVEKGERRLVLLSGGREFRSYRIALGRNPTGAKEMEGDMRTPEGDYVIDGRNSCSRYHLSLHISYPSPADLARASAAGVPPGGDIMIHGLPPQLAGAEELHREFNWTQGCIAVTNSEIEEIWQLVPDGTPIEIRP